MAGSPDFRLLFESSPAAFLVVDPAFRIVAVTNAYLAATMTRRETIVGRNLFEAFPDDPDHPEAAGARNLRASLETVLRTAEPHVMAVQKYDIRRPDTQGGGYAERYLKPVNTPVLDGEKVVYIVHQVEDVTDRVGLEQLGSEREQTRGELRSMREADHAKDEFIAIISHELRTPMTSILGWTRMLALGGLDENTGREALEALERSTLAQAKLIEDLLDESRIASGKLRLDLRVVDLRVIVMGAVSMARPSAEAKHIAMPVDAGNEVYEVLGDPARLQQAIGNLIGNAIKFTPEQGRVFVRLGREGPAAIIEVTDTGRGIAPALLPNIFERFWQGEGQGIERQSGLGLGLSITRHVIEMHDGSIAAASAGEGQGTTFTIRLPLREAAANASDLVGRDATARMVAMPRLDDVRVLIVEDEADNRKVLAAVLRHCGADVQCADTAAAALELATVWPPDVLISDISLPDHDGCAFLARLRSLGNGDGAATPALALTVLGRPGEQARILAAGFDVFRQKPIDPVDLAHDVARLARRPRPAAPPRQ